MGFFSDLKQDLSQAVNELLPDGGMDTAKNVATDTATENQSEAMSLDTMLKVIDDFVDERELKKTASTSTKVEEARVDKVAKAAEEVAEDDAEEEEYIEDETEEEEFAEDEIENEISEDEATEEDFAEEENSEEETSEYETSEADETEDEEEETSAEENEFFDDDDPDSDYEAEPTDWDLESMLENALTEEMIPTVENTQEDKGAVSAMDMNESREAVDETSVITAGMTITGDVISEGSLDLIGRVNGNIDIMGKLNITGHIIGNSKAAEIYAEGAKITGEIVSDGAIKIGASTVIVGNITASSAAIAGAVKGDIDVHGPVILDTSAIVMGNIKSKSVQINNGAVIEGMCSQCYADVSPTSFFEDYKLETKKDKNK